VADFVSEVGDEKVKSLKKLERVKGIEPSSSAWKAVALPLSYTRNFNSLALLSTVISREVPANHRTKSRS
jgi:hypothetical protein